MVSLRMLRRVALVRTDVSEELSTSFIRVTRIGEVGTTLAVTSNRLGISWQRARRNIPEDTILHSHRRENLISYVIPNCFLFANISLKKVLSHRILHTDNQLVFQRE
jgi:hypothetical protein